MYLIGLTGGIASGKSTVSKLLAELGAFIIDADAIARSLAKPKAPLWEKFVEHFGRSIVQADGTLDRRRIGEMVFSNQQERQWIDETAHPLIRSEIWRRIDECRKAAVPIVVLDIPLLYEVGWNDFTDEDWVVYVDAATQLRRLMERDQLPEDSARRRIEAQMDLAEKAKRADLVIDNSKDDLTTRRQVEQYWQALESRVHHV